MGHVQDHLQLRWALFYCTSQRSSISSPTCGQTVHLVVYDQARHHGTSISYWGPRALTSTHGRLQQVPTNTSSLSIQKWKIMLLENYDNKSCPTSRMKQAPYMVHPPDPDHPITETYGDQIHMDLAGPLPPSFPHGHKYADIFLDRHTLHIGGYPIRNKADHEKMHVQYCSDTWLLMGGHRN